jgi:glycosyltransferase involved in cell wall biosynthesis
VDRHQVAVVHPCLRAGGGSEACALWILEALKTEYSLSFITSGSVDFSLLNQFYGTRILPGEVRVISLSLPFIWEYLDATRGYRVARFSRWASTRYDLMISAYNVMDFRKRGIQFIGDFSFNDQLRRAFLDSPRNGVRRIYDDSPLRRAYIYLAGKLSGMTFGGWRNNLTVANSYWTQDILRHRFKINAPVIYPPVPSNFKIVPWEEKEDGFVYIGRLSPEKRIDKILVILGEIRRRGFPIHLHICGQAEDPKYGRFLSGICSPFSDWVHLDGPVSGDEKTRCLVSHRYGISARPNEPFGISIAELVNAGAIVWVPNGGGQREIVDCSELVYDSCDEVADKITHVLGSKTRQDALRNHLLGRQRAFSAEMFTDKVRSTVRTFLARNTTDEP